MYKILVFADGIAKTGFARVADAIIDPLYEAGYSIVHYATNYHGDPHNKPYKVYPATIGDPFGKTRFASILETERPDIILSINDIWAMGWVGRDIENYRLRTNSRLPWIHYFPVDGIPFKRPWADLVRDKIDLPVTYSEFAVDAIKRVNPELDIPYVYHGVDTDTFFPMDGIKEQFRDQYGKLLGRQINFIVGYVGRNQPRKRLPELMLAFKAFVEEQKATDALLYLHTGVVDAGWDLKEVMNTLAIPKNQVLITSKHHPQAAMDDSSLAKLYNSFDVLALPTVGEGFGLPLVEGMACGCAIMSTDCSVVPEITGEAGLLVAPGHVEIMTRDNELLRPIPSISEMTAVMGFLYKNPDKLIKYQKLSIERAKLFSTWHPEFWLAKVKEAERLIEIYEATGPDTSGLEFVFGGELE